MQALTILSDLDGVGADMCAGLDDILAAEYPHLAIPSVGDADHYDLTIGLNAEQIAAINEVMSRDGFFRNLTPFPGYVEAMHELLADGHDVRVCSTPWAANPGSAGEKLAWVAEHLGSQFIQRSTLTWDKTSVFGDVIVDDKPRISGARIPDWTHLLFTQPYNLSVKGAPRLDGWLGDFRTPILAAAGLRLVA